MHQLATDLKAAIALAGACVLVTIVRVKGSSPREPGAKMIVWRGGFSGSIGGGNLEYLALAKARALLAEGDGARPNLAEIALGPSLGQCCGGSVALLFEPFEDAVPSWLDDATAALDGGQPALLLARIGSGAVERAVVTRDSLDRAGLDGAVRRGATGLLECERPGCRLVKKSKDESYLLEALAERDPDVLLFGAGHVGRALAPLLAGLPFRFTWVDERPDEFPDQLPAGVRARPVPVPRAEVDQAPPGAFYLVMTHSHQRDFELCERIMSRGDFAYLGLIGSATKRARFEHRFREGGLDDAVIARLTCPIGVPDITGKAPAEIAVSVAAQLLQVRGRKRPEPGS